MMFLRNQQHEAGSAWQNECLSWINKHRAQAPCLLYIALENYRKIRLFKPVLLKHESKVPVLLVAHEKLLL